MRKIECYKSSSISIILSCYEVVLGLAVRPLKENSNPNTNLELLLSSPEYSTYKYLS